MIRTVPFALLGSLAMCLGLAVPAQGGEHAIDLFAFDSASGYVPDAGIITDRHGIIYGTTPIGGTGSCSGGAGCGTVYALYPPATSGASWTVNVLHNFMDQEDGESPQAPLALDRHGALYGYSYGSPGTVFRLSPAPTQGPPWALQVLYTFGNGSDGNLFDVLAPLIVDRGDVYGVASGGSAACGQTGCGSVFRLRHHSDGTWTKETLYAFGGGPDGGEPNWIAGPDTSGAFYVSTRRDHGAVVEISPAGRGWNETVISRFGSGDGKGPYNLLLAPDDTLYGIAYQGGSGIVFQLSPPAESGGGWTRVVIARVKVHRYGPASLAFDRDGSLVGAIEGDFDFFAGAIFRLTPPSDGGSWTFSELWNFNRGPDRNPLNVVPDRKGYLVGVLQGGDSSNGSLFELQ